MKPFVCYIPSYNDSELVAESLKSLAGWDVVVSDNASDEPHRARLAGLAREGLTVIRQPVSRGRIGNWKACVDHFLASGRGWMKFVMAGDLQTADSVDIYRRAMEKYPQARFLVGRIRNVYPQGEYVWTPTDAYVLASPIQAMAYAAVSGNVFHGLLAPLIHADALGAGYQFGEETLSFSADMLFLMNIARHTETLYIPEIVADFMVARRKTMLASTHSLEHLLEEGLLRLRAADHFRALIGSDEQRVELVTNIREWLSQGLQQSPARLAGCAPCTIDELFFGGKANPS